MGEKMSTSQGFIIIAERINATRKSIRRAIEQKDADFIAKEAQKQAKAGAHYIDVNAGSNPATEAEDLKWLVKIVQDAVELPLCVDCASPEALKGALAVVDKTPMINSITPEGDRIEGILPLVAEHNAPVVGLCMDENGVPCGVDARVAAAKVMADAVKDARMDISNLFIDPAICPISTSPDEALAAVEAIRSIKAEFPGIRTTCGLSNISFGLPNRNVVNRTYLAMMMGAGLDSAIIDPVEKGMKALVTAGDALQGRDEFCMRYIQAARAGLLD